MDTNEFRPELQIAQQSSRNKFRIQQDFAFYDYDAADVRNYRSGNICYDPLEIWSEMINFSAKCGGGEPTPPPLQAFPRDNTPPSFKAAAAAAAAASSDPHFFNTWKSSDPPTTSDWAANHDSVLDDVTGASSNYQNSLQDVISSDGRTFGLEFASLRQKNDSGHVSWVDEGIELHLPAYADQWSGGAGELDRGVTMAANDNSRALSLSLPSVPSPKVHATHKAERDFSTREVHQALRNWNPNYVRPLGPQALTYRNPGPLGPFTGYSTVLRSSKFLRPAQQLLEDLCCISRPTSIVGAREDSDEIMEDVRVSKEIETSKRGGGATSIVFDGKKWWEAGGSSCLTDAYGSENFQKAKLLFMQDEVCKRSKQYQQQMQMVVSSFETLAGVNVATPYVSLALKAISKHFRSLESAIMDQIKCITNSLGEELSSPPSSGGSSNALMMKSFDQSFRKQMVSCSDNLGCLEGTHILRPQRGLPERAVSIMRAWLFDHFLNPYPTDRDKHMLASQTGLTRTQVSYWFVNARVRVWKPMLKEIIHMLENKGTSDNGKTTGEACNEGNGLSNRARMCTKQVESSTEEAENRSSSFAWNQKKRSRLEYDGSLMGLVGSTHHQKGPVEMKGGMGVVSLTLGMRQSSEQEMILRCYGSSNALMMKSFDQSFHKQMGSGSVNLGSLEGTHILRPQRGLPERAVSIMRAWLFDHFLHPYPTDTEKHMLASQTGLTLTQVSNWFVNTRVRLWKPMSKEIHMLRSLDNGNTAGEACNEGSGISNRARMCTKQVESSTEEAENRSSSLAWNQKKRSWLEFNESLELVGSTHHWNGSVEMMGGMGEQSAEQGRNLRCYGGQIL